MSEKNKTKLFLSYGRRDATELANRLRCDLEKIGYEVWQDTREIRAGREWEEQCGWAHLFRVEEALRQRTPE